jgi:Fe-S oxidoreductase
MTEHKFFIEDRCTRCGECFTRCQYMELSRREAIEEIKRLIEGRPPTRKVLQKCISCYACNAFCPEDASPYELILSRWDKRYRDRGLPVRAAYLLPYHEPNYRSDMEEKMDARERELLAQWKNAPAEGEVLYPGCNLLTTPFLYDLKVFENLPVSGDWSLCCGEPFYRMGMFEVMEKIAEGLTKYYADKKVTKMVFVCPACMNMFRAVLPEKFGAKLDFECEYLVTWLLRKMDAGEIEVNKPLDREVAVHDSCHARVLGDEIMEGARELYRRLGLTVINMKHHHEEGYCCGIAAGCNRQMPQDIIMASWKELREGVGAGTGEMAIYCGGCYLMLNMAKHVVRTSQRLVHALEYLAEATGEPLPRTVEQRTGQILSNVIIKAMPGMLSTKRYKLEDIKIGA